MMTWQKDGHSESDKLSVLILTAILLWSALGLMGEAQAASLCREEAAFIVSLQGIIELRRANEVQWQQVGMDTVLCAGDSIRARTHSRAALRLRNDSMLRLDQKTSLTFPPAQTEAGKSLLDLFEGAIHIITRTPKPFKVRTPFVNASVDGTEFYVGLEQDTAKVVVYEGKVTASNALGSVVLSDHEAAIATRDQAPRKEINIRPTDAVQWALYYPAIVDFVQDDTTTASDVVRQADHLLTAGQADEAQQLLVQALEHQSNDSDIHALLAIIAVVQNEKAQALERVTRAVTLNPQSATALLAQSYVQQAHFDIEAALESVQKALGYNAQHALAWARVAELQMSLGQLERALEAAQQAVKLQPDLAKTQTVLGFAHLLQIDTQIAKEVFQRAIALDQADPIPRLGLGIALIREGELEQGRIELETAASLDPANSLIRSYLGKAYFEEKRYSLASTQFDLAKERDPKDPTPWFYDAIQKQTQNRPVEALRDIQKSIELNNNRAVYRSKFLLDRDEAARGSSLARIFENLGFERRAVMETAKSLSFDPANHSAHRFLSDTYANTPRHEIARVSELLQAQLLQPININPVQPHMAVADLNIITNTGPSSIGFNEFAPLLERNKSQVVTSGLVGSNNTIANEAVASFLSDKVSVSVGQFHYETNGFRRNDFDLSNSNPHRADRDFELKSSCMDSAVGCRNNNGAVHNIYNAFMQFAISSKLNLQAELRSRNTEHGDFASYNFYFRDYNPVSNWKLHENIVRVGGKFAPSFNQDLIISATYLDRSEKYASNIFPSTGVHFEAQHLYRQEYLNTILGGGIYHFDNQKGSAYTTMGGFVGVLPILSSLSRDNLYGYVNLNNFRNMNITLGLSHDSYTTYDDIQANKINPKIGLQWNLANFIRFRAALFETTKSHLIGQQTIEPTQVAGFNQFFDDPNGTKARRLGFGIDIHFLQKFYSGFEFSTRQLTVPVLSKISDLQRLSEQSYRGYFFWLLNSNLTFKTEFQFDEAINNDEEKLFQSDFVRLRTLNIPVNVEYFHSSGFFTGLSMKYINQELNLNDVPKEEMSPWRNSGISSFNLLDMNAGFRFPNRRGVISFEGKNLLDKEFFYRSPYLFVSQAEPRFYTPERTFFLKLVLNF